LRAAWAPRDRLCSKSGIVAQQYLVIETGRAKMSKYLLAAWLLAAVSVDSVRAEDKPFPFKVSSSSEATGWGFNVLSVTVTPLDDMSVTNIIVNRGNCHLFESHVVPYNVTNNAPNNGVRATLKALSYPMQMKFGLKDTFWTEANCELRQVEFVTADEHKWILNFVDQ